MSALEKFMNMVEQNAQKEIVEKKEGLKAELYNKLRSELATKEFVRAEINEVRAEIRQNNSFVESTHRHFAFCVDDFQSKFRKSYRKDCQVKS